MIIYIMLTFARGGKIPVEEKKLPTFCILKAAPTMGGAYRGGAYRGGAYRDGIAGNSHRGIIILLSRGALFFAPPRLPLLVFDGRPSFTGYKKYR